MAAKRLEKGRFSWPILNGAAKVDLEPAALTMLLAGMVLSNLVEEKANKIIEVLAAAE